MISNFSYFLEDVLEEMKEAVSFVKVLHDHEHRPWFEFLENFKIPKREKFILSKRIYTNLLYYRINYVEVFLVSFSLTTLLWPKPMMLIVAFIHAIAAFFLFKLCKTNLENQTVVFDFNLGVKLNKAQKLTAFAGVSLLASLGLGCFTPFMLSAIFTGIMVSFHLVFRPRSLRSKFSQYGKGSIFDFATKPVLSQVEEGRGENEYECEYEDDFEETYVEYNEKNNGAKNDGVQSQWSSVSKTESSRDKNHFDAVKRSDSLDSVDLFEKEQERRSAIYLKRREALRRNSQWASTSRATRSRTMKRRNIGGSKSQNMKTEENILNSSPNPDMGPETRSISFSSVNSYEEEKKDTELDERSSENASIQLKSSIYSKQAPISVDRTKIPGFNRRSAMAKAVEGKRD